MEAYIEAQQVNLNAAGYKGANGKPLTVDGIYGKNTQFAEAARDLDASQGGGLTDHAHTQGNTGGVA
jgi:peptidoglycan hydrolase-like protein with peptidoglycan-binding domain